MSIAEHFDSRVGPPDRRTPHRHLAVLPGPVRPHTRESLVVRAACLTAITLGWSGIAFASIVRDTGPEWLALQVWVGLAVLCAVSTLVYAVARGPLTLRTMTTASVVAGGLRGAGHAFNGAWGAAGAWFIAESFIWMRHEGERRRF